MKHILILGGSGCAGFEITRLLHKFKNYKIFPISSSKEKVRVGNIDYKFIKLDLSKKKNINHLINFQPNIIINCLRSRSKNKKLFHFINFEIMKYILEKCDSIETVVSLSSGLVYQDSKKKISEKSKLDPKDNYSKIKLKLDNFLLKQSQDRFRLLIVRPFTFFGLMADNNEIFSTIINDHIRGKSTNLTLGQHYRDFISSTYVAKFIIHLLRTEKYEGIYNVGSGNKINFKNFVNLMMNEIGIKPILLFGKRKYKFFEKKCLICNPNKLNKTNFISKMETFSYSLYEYIKYNHPQLKVIKPKKYE